MTALLDYLGSGWKTYGAGLGLIGLALYQFSKGEGQAGVLSLFGGIGAIGLRHAAAKKNGS